MSRTALFSRKTPGGVFDYVSIFNVQGDAWFVDSGCATGADSAGYGRNPDQACLTLDYAIGLASANNGDVIFVMPGHAENLTTATAVNIDQAGLRIIGLGEGADRPTFTCTAAAGAITIASASTWIENIILTNSGTFDFTQGFAINAADCTLKDVVIRDSAADSEFITPINGGTSADRLTIDGLHYRGNVGGNAAVRVISLNGDDDVVVKNSYIHGKWTTAGVGMVTTACLNLRVHDTYFYCSGTTDLSLDVVNTGGLAATWYAWNCYDGTAGKSFSGGSGGAIAGDDIGAVSTGVSTANSFLTAQSTAISTSTSMLTNTSTGVSTNTSRLTAQSTAISTNTSFLTAQSGAISTNTSFLTTSSGAVSTVSSIATNASTGVSTANSSLTALSAAISAILSIVQSGYA